MIDLSIRAVSTVSPCGNNLESLQEALFSGRLPVPMEGKLPRGETGHFLRSSTAGLSDFYSSRKTRRLDDFSQKAVLALSLAAAQVEEELEKAQNPGFIFASAHGALSASFGFLDSLIEDGDENASPMLFAGSVHNAPTSQAGILRKISGPATTISCLRQSAYAALETAACWLKNGESDLIFCAIGDDYCQLLDQAHLNAAPKSPKIEPMNFKQSTAIPGENWSCLVLSRQKKNSLAQLKLEGSCFPKEECQKKLQEKKPIVISADGCPQRSSQFSKLNFKDSAPVSFAPWRGSSDTALFFDIICSLICLKQGRFPFIPEDNTQKEIKINQEPITLIEQGVYHEFNIYSLHS